MEPVEPVDRVRIGNDFAFRIKSVRAGAHTSTREGFDVRLHDPYFRLGVVTDLSMPYATEYVRVARGDDGEWRAVEFMSAASLREAMLRAVPEVRLRVTDLPRLPRYLRTEHVRAVKIAHVGAADGDREGTRLFPEDRSIETFRVSPEFVAEYNPRPGDYYVLDGWTACSVDGAEFEATHVRVDE